MAVGSGLQFYKTTTTTTSTTSTDNYNNWWTHIPRRRSWVLRDSAGLSPAYSHERLFKRPIWDQSYGYYVSPPWSSLEELEESIQSNCLREPTCSGYQKLSCTTSWMEGGSGILVSHQNAMSDTMQFGLPQLALQQLGGQRFGQCGDGDAWDA